MIDRNYAKRTFLKDFDQPVEIGRDDGMEQNHTMLTAEGKRKYKLQNCETISRFLERVLMEHIDIKNSLDSDLLIYSVCSV